MAKKKAHHTEEFTTEAVKYKAEQPIIDELNGIDTAIAPDFSRIGFKVRLEILRAQRELCPAMGNEYLQENYAAIVAKAIERHAAGTVHHF